MWTWLQLVARYAVQGSGTAWPLKAPWRSARSVTPPGRATLLSDMAAELWTCPRCRRRFANRNQSHACGSYDLESHFAGCTPNVRLTYHRLAGLIHELGPVTVLPEKTRIAFRVRMSFAAVMPRKRWLDGHVVLARRNEHPRFRKIDYISPRNLVHYFRLHDPAEVDDDVRNWLAEAYAVGEQKHLGRSMSGGCSSCSDSAQVSLAPK